MNQRLRIGLLALAAAALAASPLPLRPLSGQEASARFRVLVPNLEALDGANRRFGERAAQELRRLINTLPTHQPVEERELRDAMRRFRISADDLDCIRARQLGQQINAELVLCASYGPSDGGFRVEASFVTPVGESFVVEPVLVGQGDQRRAAEHIFTSLETMVQQIRFAQFCGEYAASQQWENALTNCDRAIELNPGAISSRYTRALVLRETERNEEALEEFKRILELDALHDNAMQNAGYISALLGREDDARRYYRAYLELNPANFRVRMSVAYELAEAGDPAGAMEFIEEGLALEPDNLDLLKQHGGFAFAAGLKAAGAGEGATVQGAALPLAAAEFYRKALASFGQVYELEGAGMQMTQLRSMIAAHLALDEVDKAVELGARVLETHPEEAAIWSSYGDALQRLGRVDDAIAALERAKALEADVPNLAARQGKWLLDEGRLEEAIPVLQEAVRRGEQSADALAMLVFANGYQQGYQTQRWDHAIRAFRLAKQLQVTDMTRQQIDFVLAYSLFQRARAQQEPSTLATAQATLPQFQEVARLIEGCGDYARANNLENNRQQIIAANNTLIEIQEAIIRRGR